MSFTALAIVSKMHFGSAAEKLIALAYAERHNEETGCAYPSLAWLAEFSSLNRKTVISVVGRLEAHGLLTDTGKREGRTGQIKVYRVDLETVPKAEPSQKRNSSNFSGKESQKRDTDTVKEPVLSEAKASSRSRAKFILPSDIPAEPWADYEDMRKRMGKPMTDKARVLAVNRLRKLRDEDGWPPGDVLNNSTLNSYQGLFPPPAPRDRHERPDNPLAIAVQRVSAHH